MSELVQNPAFLPLTPERRAKVLEALKRKLEGRVASAYTFSHVSTDMPGIDTEIDLVLVVSESGKPQTQRGTDFLDLLEIYPHLDILVYTGLEISQPTSPAGETFWKTLRPSLRQIL